MYMQVDEGHMIILAWSKFVKKFLRLILLPVNYALKNNKSTFFDPQHDRYHENNWRKNIIASGASYIPTFKVRK